METQKITIPKDGKLLLQFEFEKEEPNMEALLEEAIKKYTIDTYVQSMFSKKEVSQVIDKPFIDGKYITVRTNKPGIYNEVTLWDSKLGWAEIISLPRKVTHLKKGEWAKCIKTENDCFTIGKLYKLRNDFDNSVVGLFIDNKNQYNGQQGWNEMYFTVPTQQEIEAHEESLKPKFDKTKNWYVEVTIENIDVCRVWINNPSLNWYSGHFVIGLNENGEKDHWNYTYFLTNLDKKGSKLISTKQFYEIIGHIPNDKPKFKVGDVVDYNGKLFVVSGENDFFQQGEVTGKLGLTNRDLQNCSLSTLEAYQKYLEPYNKKWNPFKFELEDIPIVETLKEGDAYKKEDSGYTFFGVFDKLFEDSMLSKILICADKSIEKSHEHLRTGVYTKITNEEFNSELAKQNKKWDFETNGLEDLFKTGDFLMENGSVYFITPRTTIKPYTLSEWSASESRNATKITKEEFESHLADKGLKFNYKYLDAEPLDEFAHLPQKIEDLGVLQITLIANYSYYLDKAQSGLHGQGITTKYLKAIQVQPKLLQLYEAWKDKVDWDKREVARKYVICLSKNELVIHDMYTSNHLFAFKTQKKAERFLELFRNELELYKPLMGGN